MPEYLFVHKRSGVIRRIVCPMREIKERTHAMGPNWRRVFGPPRIIRVPGFVEAMEETQGVLRDRHAHRRRLQREAQEEIAEGLRDEGIVPRG